MRKKKGQQEMLGFAFIIVLVVIIGLILLFITLRQPSTTEERENVRVNNLLNGISYYTTSCDKKNIQELIIACGRGESVTCGGPCELANREIKEILDNSFEGDYSFVAEVRNDIEAKTLIEIKKELKEVCPGRRVALSASSILPYDIIVKLISCPN